MNLRAGIEEVLVNSGMEWHESGAREFTGDIDKIITLFREAMLSDVAVQQAFAAVNQECDIWQGLEALDRSVVDYVTFREDVTRTAVAAALDAVTGDEG